MPAGGQLTVESANSSMAGRGAVSRDMAAVDDVTICFSDRGDGTSPQVVACAFDPFFTTKPLGQGAGLGMSMVYGFGKQSGDQMRVHSRVGEGASFRLYHPRRASAADQNEVTTRMTEAPRATDGETVLVVDDEPLVSMLIIDVLEDLGYAAIDAPDGAAGLKVVQSDSRIDLLITDVGLPGGMNGSQLAEAARQTRPNLKVLFVTGYAETGVLGSEQLAAGMQVLTKPFSIDMLASKIKGMLEGV
jgi:CheY-like chemotaxis protein